MSTIEFNNLILKYTNPLLAFARNLTKDHEDANDLLQETHLKAIRYKDKFREGTNIKAWLFTIMKNTFINDYRRKRKQNTMFDSTANSYYIDSTDTTVFNGGETKCNMDAIQKAITDLPDDLRIPFVSYFNGFKYNEIADELQLPLGTVKSRIFFARKELKSKLKAFKH